MIIFIPYDETKFHDLTIRKTTNYKTTNKVDDIVIIKN
jgi:hypothetical protein